MGVGGIDQGTGTVVQAGGRWGIMAETHAGKV